MITVEDSFASADVDAVRERLGTQYGAVRLTDDHLAMNERIVATTEVCINRIVLAGVLAVEADLLMYTAVLSSGPYRWSVQDERGDAHRTPVLLRPGTTATATMGQGEIIALTIDPASLQRTARMLYADERLAVHFDSAAPVTHRAAGHFRMLLAAAPEYLALLPGSELLQRSFYRLMAASLLASFRLRGDPVARNDSARAQLDGYRRARTFIDDHAHEPITVDDIAHAAALSAPQLDAAMRAHSPAGLDAAAELGRARLAGAHADLILADPTRGDTVRAIALRWGFSPSNFARRYRAV